MTREEAINHLKTVAKSAIDSGYDGAVVDAVGMAIKALQLMDKFLELPIGLPKKGKWKANMRFGMYPREEMWICSECRGQSTKRSDYCPNCGAKMEDKG